MLRLLVLLALFVRASCSDASCADFKSCLEVHLNATVIKDVLHTKRKDYIANYTAAGSSRGSRMLSFTHIPKSGGTSVSSFCKKYLKKRYDQPYPHEPYGLADMRSGFKNLFFTVLRHPLDRAVSLYDYIRSSIRNRKGNSSHLPNKFWIYSMNFSSFDEWIARKETTVYLEKQTLEMFDINTALESRGEFIEQKMKFYKSSSNNTTALSLSTHKSDKVSLSPIRLSYTAIDYSSHLSYTSRMPEKYQCKDHLRVSVLLITRYVAVGTLEEWNRMWLTLFSRAEVPLKYFDKAVSTKVNVGKSSSKGSSIEKTKKKAFRSDEIMPCDTLLWYMAKAISDFDLVVDGRNTDDVASSIAAAVNNATRASERGSKTSNHGKKAGGGNAAAKAASV